MADAKKTNIQMLSDLVEWFLSDRQVELKFVPTKATVGGKIAPEFDFQYFMDGRRITDKTLAMLIMTEMARRNYAFNLARIVAALTEHSWRFYVATFEYPDYLKNSEAEYIPKRPEGRPRKAPMRIDFDELVSKPVQTSKRKKPIQTPKLRKNMVQQHLLAVIAQRRGECVPYKEIARELAEQGYFNVNGDRYSVTSLQVMFARNKIKLDLKEERAADNETGD